MSVSTLHYPATRYQADVPTDLGVAAARERLSAPALQAFFNIMARWKVRDEDARALLGGVTNGPFYEMKRKPHRVLEVDRLTRVSYLDRHLQGPAHPARPQPGRRVGASGQSPSDLRRPAAPGVHDPGGLPAMQTVRRLLDARRAG